MALNKNMFCAELLLCSDGSISRCESQYKGPKFREEDKNKVIICPGGKDSWILSYWRKKEQSQTMSDVFVDRAVDIKPIADTVSLTRILTARISLYIPYRSFK